MGYWTFLRGTITLSQQAYQRLMALDQLGSRFELDTIADYLQHQFTYDAGHQQLIFATAHKMYRHHAFFNILANYKDIEYALMVNKNKPQYSVRRDGSNKLAKPEDIWQMFREQGQNTGVGLGPLS